MRLGRPARPRGRAGGDPRRGLHLEAVQADEAANVALHPLFLLAPRFTITQSLVRAADVSLPTPSTPAFQQDPLFNRREWSTFRPALTAAQLLFAHAGPGSGRGVDDGLKARRAFPLWEGSGPVAELVCQSCGMVS